MCGTSSVPSARRSLYTGCLACRRPEPISLDSVDGAEIDILLLLLLHTTLIKTLGRDLWWIGGVKSADESITIECNRSSTTIQFSRTSINQVHVHLCPTYTGACAWTHCVRPCKSVSLCVVYNLPTKNRTHIDTSHIHRILLTCLYPLERVASRRALARTASSSCTSAYTIHGCVLCVDMHVPCVCVIPRGSARHRTRACSRHPESVATTLAQNTYRNTESLESHPCMHACWVLPAPPQRAWCVSRHAHTRNKARGTHSHLSA